MIQGIITYDQRVTVRIGNCPVPQVRIERQTTRFRPQWRRQGSAQGIAEVSCLARPEMAQRLRASRRLTPRVQERARRSVASDVGVQWGVTALAGAGGLQSL